MLSWYPPGVADDHGEPTEDLVPAVMDAAHRHSIKVTGETTGMFFLSDDLLNEWLANDSEMLKLKTTYSRPIS